MKKNYLILSALMLTFLVMGCASSSSRSSQSDIPDWYFNPPQKDDVIFGTGSAKMSDLNMSMKMADSRARQSIALYLNTHVQAMITDYTRNAGNSESKSNLTFAETVSRQLTNAKLSGTTVVERKQGKDGTIYVLMSLSKGDALKTAADIIDSEASKYAEFKAMNALERMGAQLEKTDIKPKPVDN